MVTTQREKGQYFTPDNVVQAIVDRVGAYLVTSIDNNALSVLDPSVGEGIFCKILFQTLKNKYNSISIDALDIDPSALSNAQKIVKEAIKTNLCSVKFHLKNYLTEFDLENRTNKYDLIISNPPHNAKYSPLQWDKIRKYNHLVVQETIPSESAFYFFIKSLNLLKKGGILSFILPKPFIYSNRWKLFRRISLSQVRLLEVFDLANLFSGQLQEQVAIILQNKKPSVTFKSGFWDSNNESFSRIYDVKIRNAIDFDNFLVGVTPTEQNLLENLLKNHRRMDWIAFRGLSSEYRTKDKSIPLIEKITLTHGFFLPERSFVDSNVPELKLKRLLQPKIITQRIIGYKTKPTFQFSLPVLVDSLGEYITHETIINIVPPKSSTKYIHSYGALFQSKFINWWLRHAVYTKRFVTSKDLDKPYLNKIIIPYFDGDSNSTFRRELKSLIEQEDLDSLSLLAIKESKIDQFFSIGEIFKFYLEEGTKIKLVLNEIINQSNDGREIPRSKFKSVKQLDRFFRTKNMSELNWLNTSLGRNLNNATIEQIFEQYAKMAKLRYLIDEIVFKIYGISQNEIRVIMQGK